MPCVPLLLSIALYTIIIASHFLHLTNSIPSFNPSAPSPTHLQTVLLLLPRRMLHDQNPNPRRKIRSSTKSSQNTTTTQKNNTHSFVSHLYGMVRVKVPELKIRTHFVIMKSVFTTMKEIHK